MNHLDIFQILVYIGLLCVLTPPLGAFMAHVLTGKKTFLSFALAPVEKAIYGVSGIDPEKEMSWKQYCVSLLLFNGIGLAAVFLIQVFQNHLPLNPQHLPGVTWPLALNTAISFMTNTNWQAYAGETTLSYFSQMAALTVQNFVSAATGIAIVAALGRGLMRRSVGSIGNFWTDLVRSTIYILLPLAFVLSIILAGQGVVQTFAPYTAATTLEGRQQNDSTGPRCFTDSNQAAWDKRRRFL